MLIRYMDKTGVTTMATTMLGMMIIVFMLIFIPMISGQKHPDLHHIDLMAGGE